MRDWLPYTAAFGLALASAMGGYVMGFMIVESGTGFGLASLLAMALLPLTVAYAVFVVSFAAFSDQWLGWTKAVVGAAFVFVTTLFCFVLIAQDLLDEGPAAILLALILFFGGRFLLKRASLA